MQAALPFFIADEAQSQGQQFLRLQYGINIAGITLRITKGSIQQRFSNAGRLYAQPACAGQADGLPISSVLVAAEAISNCAEIPAFSTKSFITNSAIGLRQIFT